uniref:Receptor-like protein 12 n=1 Tax=Noccaea caerulescens TaxID=107243 RepID=A0A1J3K1S0_NOCCA
MMIPSQSYCFSCIVTLYLFVLVSLVLHTLASPTLHYCRHDQRDALLEFKDEFPVNESSPSPNDAPLSSWNKSSDCCFWKGVTCDAKSGEVISLNLSHVSLNNSLKQNSGLFKLQHLRNLTLRNSSLNGEIPSSLGYLSRLTKLNLLYNNLVGQVPDSIGNLTRLRYLDLSQNKLTGKIPISLANLTNLYLLYIHDNYLESTLPPNMSGFQNLKYFGVGGNSLSGSFPTSLFTIPSLLYFDISRNQFKGSIEFGNTFSSSFMLKYVNIGYNNFDGPIPESLSEFLTLGEIDLGYNNLFGSIPRSMSKLVNLYYLDLSGNNLEGEIPSWLWRLTVVKLSYNSFSSFAKSSQVPDETQIIGLGLNSNSLKGPFPNWICELSSLHILDLSDNRFSGLIPQCFGNSTITLQDLFLRDNNFTGIHPDVFVNATNLRALDISYNKLEGKLVRSLVNCRDLRFLNLKSNRINDEFPFWLGSLPSLNILLLQSNRFHGPLYHRHLSVGFQSLRVIDVSRNDLCGTFPAFYFSDWREMTTPNAEYDDTYMKDSVFDVAVYHSMKMVNKGVDTEYDKIRTDFIAIDFSGNRLRGTIPESIGMLRELHLLNLSGNEFTGHIPPSLANLTKLEALDLSRNHLSGQIPPGLGSLSFLSTMNFSHNYLQGPIPPGTQFQSQNCSSFMDNHKLYGLEDICGETLVSNPTPEESEDLSEAEEHVINWIAAAIAYGPGVFCGLVIGHIFAPYIHEWFMEKFGRKK